MAMEYGLDDIHTVVFVLQVTNFMVGLQSRKITYNIQDLWYCNIPILYVHQFWFQTDLKKTELSLKLEIKERFYLIYNNLKRKTAGINLRSGSAEIFPVVQFSLCCSLITVLSDAAMCSFAGDCDDRERRIEKAASFQNQLKE